MRAPEPGSTNLGGFLAENASGLAQELGVSPTELEAQSLLDDEEVAPRIRQLLERAKDRHVQRDLERRRERSLAAAHRLGGTVRWTDFGAVLDVDILLGEVLADRGKKWLAFDSQIDLKVVIPRHLVTAVVPLRRSHIDLAAFATLRGLSFRWKAGRGGLNLWSREVDPRFADRVLIVPLAPPRMQVPERRRGGAWLGSILREMGYVV
jgi:hypothetical protein